MDVESCRPLLRVMVDESTPGATVVLDKALAFRREKCSQVHGAAELKLGRGFGSRWVHHGRARDYS
jgi:hypothetical protein